MPYTNQINIKTVNLFVPYYSSNDQTRQAEIDQCLLENANNEHIDRIFLLIDDQSRPVIDSPKIELIFLDERPTYKMWIEETKNRKLSGVSLLANSDIHFDQSLCLLDEVFGQNDTLLCLTRWEQTGQYQLPHPNPQWSQDVWGINCNDQLSPEFLDSLNFCLGVPRCDNKIAYLFSTRGWRLSNPCKFLKSIHVHESDVRNYDKKQDLRILGGVAYVHPSASITADAKIDIDIWTLKSTAVSSVALNKTLEQWKLESQYGPSALNPEAHHVETSTSQELLNAFRKGESVFKEGHEFEVLKSENIYYFKNQNEILSTKKISYINDDKNEQHLNSILALGFIPSVISTHSVNIRDVIQHPNDINFWQYPCATEKQAYQNHLDVPVDQFIDYEKKIINTYLPLPWATYIDKSECPEALFDNLKDLVSDYKTFSEMSGFELRIHTVCQHIHWRKIIGNMHHIGVTDLHLSHKYSNSTKISENRKRDIRLHCWPLIAVNFVSPGRNCNLYRKQIEDKNILASFIGAQMPHYRNESRVEIKNAALDFGKESVLVELKEQWHYNKVVYEEQVKNKPLDNRLDNCDIQRTARYNQILSDSIFSLCPEGAGPNTLRFWESIAIGCIPVIFSDDVAIFQESRLSAELLDCIVRWNKPIDKHLFEFLESMDRFELEKMRLKLIELYPSFESFTIFDNITSTSRDVSCQLIEPPSLARSQAFS